MENGQKETVNEPTKRASKEIGREPMRAAVEPPTGYPMPDDFCAQCGVPIPASAQPITRFGEAFCSPEHAERFAQAVAGERARVAAHASESTVESAAGMHCGMAATAPGGGWKNILWKVLCWGGPALAVVLLLGGGSTLLGFAGSALPVVAALACPLAMILMMRGMSHLGQPPQQPKISAANQTDDANPLRTTTVDKISEPRRAAANPSLREP